MNKPTRYLIPILLCIGSILCNTSCSSDKVKEFPYPMAEATESYVPNAYPHFDIYTFSNNKEVSNSEFAIYKVEDKFEPYDATITEGTISQIYAAEVYIEPAFDITTNKELDVVDNHFDKVGVARPNTYYLIGLTKEWAHVADSTGQAGWIKCDELRSSTDTDFTSLSENTVAKDVMDAEDAQVTGYETQEYTKEITYLWSSICYIFPEGTYTFKGNNKNITIRSGNVILDEVHLEKDKPYTVTLSEGTEVYSDMGVEVK